MRIARTFNPTFGDIQATDRIIRERMTVPYRKQVLTYLARYGLPKCLRMVKLWVWDIRGQMEQAPDPTEDGIVQEQHLRDVLAAAHDYDGVSTFPKIVKEENIRWINARKRRRRVSTAPSPSAGRVTKTMKINVPSDDEEEVNQQQPPPPSGAFEPVTPPRPLPQDDSDEDGSSRPPRVHRPKPTDPRLNRHQQPPPSPATVLKNKEEAGREMGLDSYVVESVV